jgi:hypothetical protein
VSIRLGAEAARDALAHSKLRAIALGLAAFTIAVGFQQRSGDASGADRALLGVTLSLVVPFACYAVFECAHGRAPSAVFYAPLARHGADRHRLALGSLLVITVTSTLLAASLAVLAVFAASTVDRELLGDLYACTWGGALVGAAYAGLFALGAPWGRKGRLWLLLADWLFGSGSGVLALPWVRGHARNLLGGAPVLQMPPGFAAAALAAISALYILASASRGPR